MQILGRNFFLLVSILFLLNIYFIKAETNISGFVYNDTNKNGVFDQGEQGIENICVSNQREVVLTDENGKFSLPLIPNNTVFITKPAGFNLPLDNNNLPQFYYIYSPHGSPAGFKFEGLTQDSKPPDTLFFPLYATEYHASFKTIITGDPQQRDSTEVNYFRDDVVTEMIDTDACFYMALGDIAADNLSIYQQYNDVVSQLGIPIYSVPGNHDENYRAKNDTNALDTFKRIYGPEYYSFNYGKVHFIVLDIVDYAGWNSDKNSQGSYRGYLKEDQLTWLKNDLAFVPEDNLIVLSMHIPIYTAYSLSENMNLVNRDALFKILNDRRHLLALSGHLHLIENLKFESTIGWNSAFPFISLNLGAGCGAWWSGPKDERGIPVSYCMDGSPNGYYVFTFEGNAFNQHFYPAGMRPDYQMRISNPDKPVKRDSLVNTQIIVNVFNADYETEVYCQVDGSDRKNMTRKSMKDPFMIDYFNNNKNKFPYWVTDVENTDHIWVATLPANLLLGQHLIKVSAIDGSNNIYSGIKLFEVQK